ncbi:MAG: hypothetical protein IJH32_00700 [Ruminococcus sp.]|nr:hypothetical protein [Ruminococcus sp.]MBQ6152478.1 hypothetical protein [Ruminococcus sp.]
MEEKHLQLKHRLMFGGTMALFLTTSLLIYGPLSLYIKTEDRMWFSFYSLLVPVILVSIAALAVFTLALSLPKGTLHKLLCCLVFGVALGFYIQNAFFNISYGSGVLDGSEIVWKDYTTYGAIDSAMWAACLALPFAFYMVFKKQWRHILMFTAVFFMVLQAAGLALVIYQNQGTLDKMSHEVTKDGIYELSENENTLVFVVGSMDYDYWIQYKENHPDRIESLEGFTDYNNTLASGAGSMISFPAMMTGEIYKKDIKYSSFINNIWESNNVFTLFDDSDVDARIYCDEMYFSNDASRKVKNVASTVQGVDAYSNISATMYKYTMYNCMPHYLKKLFWFNGSEFSTYSGNSTYDPANDGQFFSEYRSNRGYTYTDKYDNAVRVYYLQGAQAPYRLTEDGERSSSSTSLDEVIEGSLNSVFEMIDDLIDDGKYDSTEIIITGDNGERNLSQHPMLLYKPKNAAGAYTESDAPVTLFDLPSTLASSVSSKYYLYGSGKTFKDAEKLYEERVRYFYLNAGSNADSRVEQYKSSSKASDYLHMTLQNNYYVNGGVVENYRLGEELMFTTDETAAIYCTEGFGHTNGYRTMLRGPHGQMVIPIENVPQNDDDLHVFFNVLSVSEPTECIIYANGEEVYDRVLNPAMRNTGLNFLVPEWIIDTDGTLTLDFYFPEISDDEMNLEANDRTIIMSFTSFKIYTQ